MKIEVLEFSISCTYILVLTYIIISSVKMVSKKSESMLAVLFTFCMVSFLMSELYWTAYNLLRPDSRMPFAANEMGEWAFFLLMSAGVSSLFYQEHTKAKAEMVYVSLFCISNVVLWIAWSGEWIQDIITGLVLAYFMCTLAHGEKQIHLLSSAEKRMIFIVTSVLVIMQGSIFFAPASMKSVLDLGCYLLMFSLILMFLSKTVFLMRSSAAPRDKICMSFIAFAWGTISMYMSEGNWYNAELVINIILLLFMLKAVKQEVYRA